MTWISFLAQGHDALNGQTRNVLHFSPGKSLKCGGWHCWKWKRIHCSKQNI